MNKIKQVLFKYGLMIYNLVCLALAINYGVIHQFQRYLNNDDVSSIGITKLNVKPKDIYPAYSLCFEDNPLRSINSMYNSTYLNAAFDFQQIKFPWCDKKDVQKEVCIA